MYNDNIFKWETKTLLYSDKKGFIGFLQKRACNTKLHISNDLLRILNKIAILMIYRRRYHLNILFRIKAICKYQ